MSNAPQTLVTNRYQPQARDWLDFKRQFEIAKERLSNAKDRLVATMSEDDGPYVIVKTPQGDVAVTDKDRRTFDAKRLISLKGEKDLLALGVIEYKVNPDAFDKAVATGKIDAKVVSKVSTTTSYTDVRLA